MFLNINTISVLIIFTLWVRNSEETVTFDNGEINIHVPKRIGNFITNIPGFSSVFKPQNEYESTSHNGKQKLSFIPFKINLNLPNTEHDSTEYVGRNQQYPFPPTNIYENNYAAPQYLPGFYNYGHYVPPTFQQNHQPHCLRCSHTPQMPGMQPLNPPPSYSGSMIRYPNRPILEYTMPPLAPFAVTNNPLPPIMESTTMKPSAPIAVTKNPLPVPPILESTTMTPLVPIAVTDNPHSRSKQPKRIITPDSPLYVKIPVEPTIDGIEPRR